MPSLVHHDRQPKIEECDMTLSQCVGTNFSFRENYDSVEHVENLQSWLVDGEHYSSIGVCQSIQMNQ